jgi:hypothetical protein
MKSMDWPWLAKWHEKVSGGKGDMPVGIKLLKN